MYLQPADIYLIDEPSAYLDSEQRLIAAKVIKRSVAYTKNIISSAKCVYCINVQVYSPCEENSFCCGA